MRRFMPHLLVLITGLTCLAVTWYFEPPIQYARGLRGHSSSLNRSPKQGYLVRVVAQQELQLKELILQVSWDTKLLRSPRVLHGRLTRQAQPRAQYNNSSFTATFKNRHGKKVMIAGKGPVARFGFNRVPPKQPIPRDTVQLTSAIGIRPDGTKVEITGLKLVPIKPLPAKRRQRRR